MHISALDDLSFNPTTPRLPPDVEPEEATPARQGSGTGRGLAVRAAPVLPVLLAGTLAATLSGSVLLWRSRRETGSPAAAVNAPSQWLWGREALRERGIDTRHTLLGTAVHWLSSCFWAVGYEWLRRRHADDTPLSAVRDAAAVAGVAAVTDLALVPERLTPGFEKHLSRRSLGAVYASFAAGLAVAALLTRRR